MNTLPSLEKPGSGRMKSLPSAAIPGSIVPLASPSPGRKVMVWLSAQVTVTVVSFRMTMTSPGCLYVICSPICTAHSAKVLPSTE